MRLQAILMTAGLALAWLGFEATSQDPPGGPFPGGGPPPPPPPGFGGPPGDDDRPPPFPPPSPIFEALDTDNDGVISAKEMHNAAEALKALDRNHDGKLTEAEVRPPGPPPGFPPGPGGRRPDPAEFVKSLMRLDRDNDGKVSGKELPERMSRLLEQADANHDGALDRDEAQAFARRPGRRLGPPPGDAPRRKGGRRPGPPPGEGPEDARDI